MADFDLDSYFAKRIGSAQPEPVNSLIPNPVNEIPQADKIAELQRASAQKLDGLEKYKARVTAQEKANEASLVGQLGLDPEGTVGTGVNLVARGLAGASKNVIGQLLAVPSSVKATIHELGLDEEDRQAYVRHTQGVATSEDMARLSFKGQARDASTKLEMFQKADQSTEIAKDIRDAFNIDYLTHKANTDQLNADLGEGFQGNWDQVKEGWSTLTEGKGTSKGLSELASGLGGLIYKAGEAGATNPMAVTEYIAENLPQMFMGGAGKMGAALLMETNAGYAYENYEKGIAKYREENNGAFPPEAERQKMAAYAASLALAEQLGDITAIKGMFPAKAVKGVAEAADAVTTGFKKGLLNTLNAGAKSLAVESGTEGWQTFAEGEATLKPATPEEIYTGASIGGLTGGSMSGGARGVAELLKATPEHVKLKNLDADKAKALDEAIASGDVTGYTNTKSKDYAPERAIAALFGNSQLETTTPEAKQENLAKASKIIADLEERKTGMQTSLDELSPTAVEGYKAQLEVIKEKQKQVDPANTQEVAELSSTASFYEGLIKDAGSKLPKQLEASMSKLDTQLEESRTSLEQLKLLLQPKDVEVEALVQEIQEAPSKDALAAGSAPRAEPAVGVINLSMQAPDRLDPTTATELADNQENALTAPQRAYLRAFSAARIAENILKDMGQVSQEIFSGSPTGKKGTKYVGIAQYRARMAEAMSTLNREAADRFLGGLTKFMSDHQAKLSVAEQALAKGLGNQIVKADGEWVVSPERLSDAKIKEGGGLTVNSPGLVANIRAETDALVKAQAEMAAAYDLTFKKEPEKSVVQSAPAEKKAEPVKNTSSEKILEVKPRLQEEPVDPSPAPSPEVEESVEATTPVVESGSLSALQNKSPEGTGFKQRNLLADYFTQQAGKEGDVTKRALVEVKDFLSALSSGAAKIADFLKATEITENQHRVLEAFQAKAVEWQATIKQNLVKGNVRKDSPDFYYNDLMQFLIQGEAGNLDLEENVKTAISYAAFSYVAEKAGDSFYNTPAEINAILGREEDALISEKEVAVLGKVGVRETVVRNSLGQTAVQALGFKASKDAPLDLTAKLEAAMGAHVEKLLMDLGMVERVTIPGTVMAELTGNEKTSANVAFRFLRLARPDGKLHPDADAIYQANKNTQGVLDKLFSVEPGLKEPSLEPIPFNQASTKNTSQAIPETLKKIIQEANNTANYIRQDNLQVLGQLDEDVALAMAGVEFSSEAKVHKSRRESVRAKNDGLRREFSRFMEYVKGMADQDAALYFEHSVWKQQRVGIATNVINPQTSKIHRHMLYRKSWETKIAINDEAQMENFLLRVAEGLGIKTDKQSNEKSLPQVLEMVGSPVIKDAVAVLRQATYEGGISTEQQQTLLAGVKAGGQNFHSFDALMALAHFKQAQAEGKTDFTVQLMGEVDGVTNGPMLSHLLFGAADSVDALFGLLNRGGFFEEGNQHNQYSLWREAQGNLDLYESTSLHMTQAVQSLTRHGIQNAKGKMVMPPQEVAKVMGAIYTFTGTLADKDGKVSKAGRNIIKTPLTAMVFGSSVSSALYSMADKFIESIYGQIESLVDKPADRAAVIQALNDLGLKIAATTSVDELMNMEFSAGQISVLNNVFKKTLGVAVRRTMEQDFAVYIDRRKEFNKAAQLSFELYNAAYTGMREQMIADLIASGEMEYREVFPKDENGKALTHLPKIKEEIHDLTASQEGEIRKRLRRLSPVLHTAMSKDSGSLNAGLHMSKSNRKLSDKGTYEGEVQFATPFPDNKAYSATTRGYEVVESAPGVAMAPMSVHSTDSAISHYAASGTEVLNVHDAHGSGAGTFEQTARNLNKATWDNMLKYSPPSEMFNALARTINGLADLMKEDVPASVKQNLVDVLTKAGQQDEIASVDVLYFMASNLKYLAFQADDMKLQALGKMASIDQYALQGGNYEVTDKDQAEAASLRAALSKNVPANLVASIDSINESLTSLASDVKAEADPEMDVGLKDMDVLGFPAVQAMQLLEHASQDTALSEDLRTQADQVLTQMTTASQSLKEAVLKVLKPADAAAMVQLLSKRFSALPANQWGEQGQSAIQSDTALVEFFESNANVTADRAIQMLYQTISKGANNNIKEFNLKLLKVLFKTVNPKMVIRYVTPATEPSMVLEGADKSRGWYVSKGGKSEIYVLSPAYKHSGLTVETLIHELVHAAISQSIESATGEAKELVDELGTLLERARAHVNQAGLKGYGSALANVQELVAWGMSNLDFQKNVLNQITVETKTGSNTLVSGMKKFIDTMVGLLFRGSKKSEQQIASNGMSVLIANVSGLFAEAAKSNTAVDMVLNQESKSPLDDVIDYSTTDIYTALRQASGTPLDSSFDEHLRGVLGNIVTKLHGPFDDFKKQVMKTQALGPMDIWLKALDTGVAPFASQALASGFKIPAQVAFVMEQVEVTIKAALENNEAYTKTAYKELSDLYTEVSARLQPKDFHDGPWATATANEQAIATELYNFIFKVEQTNGKKSDYLARFAALGLTHPHLNKLLQVPTAVKVAGPAKTFAERLQSLFEKVLGFFSNKIAHTYEGQPADEKLLSMVGQLVDIEAKHRQQIASRAAESNYVAPVEEAVKAAAEAVRSKVGQLASNPFLRNHKSGYVRGASAVVSTLANDRVEAFMEGLAQFRNENFKGKLGIAAGLLNDMKGPVQDFLKLLLESKSNERTRKSIITNAAKGALAAFVEGGKALTPKAKASLSVVFLRTGAHALVDHFTMADLEQLVSDKARRTKEIQDWEAKLAGFNTKHQNYFKYQAKALAYYKAVGKSTSEILMLNAHAIVNMYGTVGQNQITQAESKQAEGIVDVLVSLYALEYSDSVHLSQAAQVLRAENARGTENGVEFLLKLHKKLEAESEARLFRGNRTLMVKGYTPEIFNPYVDLKIVEEGSEESKDLIDQGYALGDAVPRDPSDPGTAPRRIHVLRGKGLQPHVTGVISYSGKKAKGSPQHNGYLNVNTQSGAMNASMNAEFMNNKALGISQMFANNPGFDPRKTSANFAVPLLNERGEVVNWRYMMTESSKDVLLERTNDFDKIIGTLAGSIYDKQTTEEHNEKAIAALREDYLAGYAKNQKAYVLVGPKSTDPEMREIWALLPDATKADARKIWGYDGMMVRLDSLDVMFGYRKLSIASFLNNDAETLEGVQKIMREWFGVYARSRGMNDREADNYAKKLGLMFTKGERVWQEIVRETKDLIVVKTGTVMLGNIWSNMSYLVLSGVSMKDIVHHHIVALKGATAYRKDSDELFRLKTLRDTGYTQGNDAEIAKNIARLEDALARNPVVELIDAGLMPTITEDIAQDEDVYSYKTGLVKKMDGITKKLNPAIVSGARTVYMAHDTRLYQGLSRVTQLSDFVARYTLYQHMTTRKTGPLTKEAAVIQASEAFINYDVPMHRGMQYMDDMGITPFMKYYLRIQKVLLKMGRENPARVMATLLLGNLWDLGPIVLEGSAFTRIGNNPLEAGAFNFPGALTDLATLSVFK